jgi:mannose-6-phosphate isomerase-like protein (cupin superfamily)
MKRLKVKRILSAFFCLALIISYANGAFGHPRQDVETIMNEFINDYLKNDKLPESPTTFGIHITGPHEEKWTVSIDKNRAPKVNLRKGFPNQPTFYAVTDFNTLKKIYDGELNALTAGGRARMSDKTPLNFGFMEGFQPPIDYINVVMLPLGFHFFNRGTPEIIPFGEKFSRSVHGGNTVIFYYQKGLRTAWYQIKKGMKINEDPELATNPFPTLFIMTKGKGMGRLGDDTMSLKEGMAIFVPAGMIHQFWTESDSGLEFVIVMFGEGA